MRIVDVVKYSPDGEPIQKMWFLVEIEGQPFVVYWMLRFDRLTYNPLRRYDHNQPVAPDFSISIQFKKEEESKHRRYIKVGAEICRCFGGRGLIRGTTDPRGVYGLVPLKKDTHLRIMETVDDGTTPNEHGRNALGLQPDSSVTIYGVRVDSGDYYSMFCLIVVQECVSVADVSAVSSGHRYVYFVGVFLKKIVNCKSVYEKSVCEKSAYFIWWVCVFFSRSCNFLAPPVYIGCPYRNGPQFVALFESDINFLSTTRNCTQTRRNIGTKAEIYTKSKYALLFYWFS